MKDLVQLQATDWQHLLGGEATCIQLGLRSNTRERKHLEYKMRVEKRKVRQISFKLNNHLEKYMSTTSAGKETAQYCHYFN